MGRDPTIELTNKKYEIVANCKAGGMTNKEAAVKAGYKEEWANKNITKILAKDGVRDRIKYLTKQHNAKLEEDGYISRESLLKRALNMLSISEGEELRKDMVKYSDYWEQIQYYKTDPKEFNTLFDKICIMMDYYPKTGDKGNGNEDVVKSLESIEKAVEKRFNR